MISIRSTIFETNSSSTHSFSIPRDSTSWEKLRKIFDSILYGEESIVECYDSDDLVNIIKKLNEAQNIIIAGEEDYY